MVTHRVRKARIIIADDHELSRVGLRTMLLDERNLEIVGEVGTGRAAVELCRQLQPDLAILDVRMPDMDGIAATRAIKQIAPQTIVIILTLYGSPEYLVEAIRAGAAGYLLKDMSRQDLIGAIYRLLRGEAPDPGIVSEALLRQAVADDTTVIPPSAHLTPREREVLALLVHGHTNREIAERLTISVGTVKNHVEHIIAKLGVSDRTQAAVYALRAGILD